MTTCRRSAGSGCDGGTSRLEAGPGACEPNRAPEPTEPAKGQAAAEGPDIETALGTRWAVWVGGLALALGGIFLVRYSIEAGFFGPGCG